MICANRFRAAAGAILSVCVAVAAQQPAGLTKIGPAEYKKLETREATELAVMKALRPGRPGWGEFYIITPFPYDNRRGPKLKDTNPPESELSKMRAGGPGPDLNAEYEGKTGGKLKWSSIGMGVNRTVKAPPRDST